MLIAVASVHTMEPSFTSSELLGFALSCRKASRRATSTLLFTYVPSILGKRVSCYDAYRPSAATDSCQG